jgi:hypothetical protein
VPKILDESCGRWARRFLLFVLLVLLLPCRPNNRPEAGHKPLLNSIDETSSESSDAYNGFVPDRGA